MNDVQNRSVEEISLKVVFLQLFSKWYLFLFFIGLFFALAYVYLNDTPPSYAVQASLLINDKKVDRSQGERFMNEIGLFAPNKEREDEVGILTSYSLLSEVARSMDKGIAYSQKGLIRFFPIAEEDCPFTIQIDSSHSQVVNIPLELTYEGSNKFLIKAKAEKATVQDLIFEQKERTIPQWEINELVTSGITFEKEELKFELLVKKGANLTEGEVFKFTINSLERQTYALINKLEVKPLEEEGNIIQLSTEGFSVEHEQDFLNTLLELYLSEENKRKLSEGQSIISLIDKQIDEVADSLKAVEDLLETFRSDSKIVDINTTSEELTKRILDLEKDLSRVKGENQYFRQIEDYFVQARRGQRLLAPSALDISDPMMTPLLKQLSDLYQERAKLLQSAKPGNPQLERLEREILNVSERLSENAKNRVVASDIQLRQIQQNISSTRWRLSKLPGNAKQLNRLEREFTLIEKNYQYLLEKKSEAKIALANASEDKFVLDQARQLGEKPTSPNKMMIYFMALVSGLGLPLGIVLLMNTINDRIKGLRDIHQHSKIPVIGVVLSNKEKIRLLSSAHVGSPLAESFRTIRMHVRDLLPNRKCRVVGVTSTWSGEGKTFCAANLASMIALSGHKVLILDLDLRKADLHKNFNANNKRGFSEYLQGTEPVENVLQNTEVSNLSLITAGLSSFQAVDLLESKKFSEAMATFKEMYDFIIIDTPPFGETPDYILLKEYIDLTLYIVRHKRTTTSSLSRINEMFNSGRIKNVEIVVNDVSQKQSYGLGDDTFGYGTKIGYYHTGSRKKKAGSLF